MFRFMPAFARKEFLKQRSETVQILCAKTHFFGKSPICTEFPNCTNQRETVQFPVFAAVPSNGCRLEECDDKRSSWFFAHQTVRYHSTHSCRCDRLVCSCRLCFEQFSLYSILYSLGILYSFASIFVLVQKHWNNKTWPLENFAHHIISRKKLSSLRECQCHVLDNLASW